jgi:acyl CoA:acetate/3-ketoacid CoA transferase beta subunit
VITTKAILRFGDEGEAHLSSVHPGIDVQDVTDNIGWQIKVSEAASITPEPTPDELHAIREYDKEGFWTR